MRKIHTPRRLRLDALLFAVGLTGGLGVALLPACDDAEEPIAPDPATAQNAEEPTDPETDPETPPESEPAEPTPARVAEDARVHQDLLALSHLADVDVGGAWIDFGTQDRFKYTSGNWNSGWGKDGTRDGESYSRFGRMGRVYFDVREPGALTVHARVRNVAGGPLLAFMNGEALREHAPEQIAALGEGFVDLTIPVPAEHVRRGENYLLFRGTETRAIEGEEVSFEVASVHVARGERPADFAAPTLRQRVEAGGAVRQGLRIPAGARLSWTFEVPPDATLEVERAALTEGAQLGLALRRDRGATPLDQGPAPATFAAATHALAAHAGRIVQLDVVAEGGDVALGALRLVVPDPELPAIGTREAPTARNVIVLTIDTLRASKLRPYDRRSRVRTPAFDAFAAEGVLFERAQTPENWTKPAVASILTSLFPATHGAKNDSSRLPHSALTLGEVYQSHGYRTASFLANGYVSRAFGFDQGWTHYTNYIRERRNTNASNVFGEAAAWIEEHVEDHEDEGFFVYIQTIDPHVPYDPPDEFLRMYDARRDYAGQVQNRRTHLLLEEAKRRPPRVTFDESDVQRLEALHDGEISYHDRHFGAFLRKLQELGLDENTIVVVTSDHGEEFHEHGSWGHGHSIFQELLHVPLVVRYPGVGRPGARVPHVVSTMGIAPTVLEATGHEVPAAFEGRSLMPFVRGASAPGPWVAFSDFQENRRVIRGGSGLEEWKLVLRSSLTYVLFDLKNDPGEQHEVDPRQHPVAMRYLRTLSGQMLGASDRSQWLSGGSGPSRVQAEDADMTLELCQQLVALGYMDCTAQFPQAM